MTLHGVTFRTAERQAIGPVHLELYRRQRILVRCESEPAYAALLDILTGRESPLTGRVVELERVAVQTDRRLRDLLLPNKSIQELLHEAPLPDTIWIGGRRRSTQVVMDRLGLSPHQFRKPLKLESEEVLHRFWALRFVSSNADLLIGREVFELPDETIRRVLQERWPDFPGAVLCAAVAELSPGPTNALLAIDSDGGAHFEPTPGSSLQAT
jgi:hypothetical protein